MPMLSSIYFRGFVCKYYSTSAWPAQKYFKLQTRWLTYIIMTSYLLFKQNH